MKRARWLSALGAMLGALVFAPGASATYPGHNGLIAFAGLTGDHTQIYTIRPNGLDMRQLTYADADVTFPDWSPDGRRIVFEIDYADHCSVAIMDADGHDLVQLTGQPNVCDGEPSFTPDGRRIMFSRFDSGVNVAALWSMDVSGADQHEVTAAGDQNPAVSPDGTTVSFIRETDTGSSLLRANVDGSGLTELLPPDFAIAIKHDWAPDGRHLLIGPHGLAPDPNHPSNIATIRPDRSDLHYLTHNTDPAVHVLPGTYSPNGKYIVFRLDEDRGDSAALMEMRSDGSHVRQIRGGFSTSGFKPRFIDWGPPPTRERCQSARSSTIAIARTGAAVVSTHLIGSTHS
jgi:Tol biopolymer transport system component